MKAAKSGFRKPALASATPTVSTAIVPVKFCQMMRRVLPRDCEDVDEANEVVAQQHDIGTLTRHIGARAHGNADICLGERRSIVDTVPQHRDHATPADQIF